MVSLLGGNYRGEGGEGEVDTGEWNQVSLKFVQVNIEGAIESQRSSDGGDNLGDQPVQVGKTWGGDAKVLLADVIDSLIINHEGAVGVFKSGVGSEDGVVGLNDGVGKSGSRVHAELELGFLSIVSGKALKDKSTETRTSSTTE
jgi:hypothetical protein